MVIYNPTPLDDTPVDAETAKSITSNWAYDHAADLDAHILNIGQITKVGSYYCGLPSIGANTRNADANYLFMRFLWIPRDMTFDRIGVEITTAAGVGELARLGLYNVNQTTFAPGTVLLDAGTIAIDATGLIAATINQQLTKGWWATAYFANGTAALRLNMPAWSPYGYTTTYKLLTPISELYKSLAYAALPDTPTGLSEDYGHGDVVLRVSSLD